ncbi:hypothetical protein ABZ897_41245 [Nonomuraea sp. NPDC046802]|uniref:hypothetical protein n=1 Tax=Nonomuraea sp. NPDC046802 TaxID=3154919 RepID=UPI0033D25307
MSEDSHQVVAAVGDGKGLVAACDEHQPEVVIADVRMSPTFTSEGLRAALAVRRRHPGIGVLVLSQLPSSSTPAYTGSATCSRTRGRGRRLPGSDAGDRRHTGRPDRAVRTRGHRDEPDDPGIARRHRRTQPRPAAVGSSSVALPDQPGQRPHAG